MAAKRVLPRYGCPDSPQTSRASSRWFRQLSLTSWAYVTAAPPLKPYAAAEAEYFDARPSWRHASVRPATGSRWFGLHGMIGSPWLKVPPVQLSGSTVRM